MQLESDSLFFHSFHHAVIGMALVNPNGRFMKVNHSLLQMLGYAEDELLDKTYADLTHPDDMVENIRNLEQLLQGERQSYQKETRYIHRDGCQVWTSISVSLVRDQANRPAFFIVQIQDITERKQAEKAQQLYHLVAENAQDIIACNSPDGIIQYISPAVTPNLGYEPDELVGKRSISFYHPDDVVALQKRTYKDADVFWCRIRHKNGQYIWFETTIKSIRNEQGQVEKILGVVRNIAKRKRAEDENRKREEGYRKLVEHSPDAILVSADRKFIYVNETAIKLFGAKNKEELLRVEPLTLIHPDHRPDALRRRTLTEQGFVVDLVEMKFLRLDGQVFEVEVKSIPVHYNGEPAIHTIVRDIAHRKKTQQLLQQTEKLKAAGELAAGIAHEMRNPLTSLKGFLQLMDKEAAFKEFYVSIMREEMNRMEIILSELLQLARPKTTNFKTNHLWEIIHSVIALLESEANLKGIQMNTNDHGNELLINCDENQIKQVFINLIKNAIEAMPDGGEIMIDVQSDQSNAYISFADQGVGIPEDKLTEIGKPFFTTKETGTGLGLSVCFTIIDAHKGNINVESTVGVGTTFTVTLPLS